MKEKIQQKREKKNEKTWKLEARKKRILVIIIGQK